MLIGDVLNVKEEKGYGHGREEAQNRQPPAERVQVLNDGAL